MHPVGAPVDELTGIRILPQYGSQFLARDFAFVRIKPRSRHGQGIDRNFCHFEMVAVVVAIGDDDASNFRYSRPCYRIADGSSCLNIGAEPCRRSGKRFDQLEWRVKRSAQPEHWDRDTGRFHKPQHRQRS
jgi:hypothetical protein